MRAHAGGAGTERAIAPEPAGTPQGGPGPRSAGPGRSTVASLGEELRAPLEAVIGFLDLLAASNPTDKQRDHIDGAQTSAKHLLAVVSDLLDAATIESGRLDLDGAPFEPATTVLDAVNVVQNTARAKGLHLTTVIGPELRTSFLGDALRTRQILINLVTQAVKLARSRVEVRALWRGETDSIEIEIEDDGPGIAPDRVARVFEPHRREDETGVRAHGETRMGLSIARDLARLMRGDITARSEAGRGAIFRFSAPLLRAKVSEGAPAMSAAADHRLRVLLAVDDATNRLVASELLTVLGHEVCVAADGPDAIQQALAAPFDLLVLDVEMPRLDGPEVTRRLRSAGLDVPVLGFTSHASTEQRHACLRAGMNGVVQKPANLERLSRGIASVIARAARAEGGSRDLARSLARTACLPTPAVGHHRGAILRAVAAVKVPPPRSTSADIRSGLDLDELQRRVGGDRALFEDVLAAVREEAGRMFVELAAAAARGDLEAVRRIAHTLKGCVANVGARPVVEAVVGVEVAAKEGDLPRAQTLVAAAVSRSEPLLAALANAHWPGAPSPSSPSRHASGSIP
jgi:two-component system sensor histidine kinase/response regulator